MEFTGWGKGSVLEELEGIETPAVVVVVDHEGHAGIGNQSQGERVVDNAGVRLPLDRLAAHRQLTTDEHLVADLQVELDEKVTGAGHLAGGRRDAADAIPLRLTRAMIKKYIILHRWSRKRLLVFSLHGKSCRRQAENVTDYSDLLHKREI